nr:reverse transcriptase domain-containing protein [Tanacetum cinerariifolium]
MSTRSSTRNLFLPLDNHELTIRRRSRSDLTLLNNSEMAAEGPDDLSVLDLRTMEELCQPSLNGRGGPITPIAIQATNFGLKNDMIQQVQNSCQFHGLPGNGDIPVPDLRTMEELCQPSLNGWGGLIALIAIQATNFGLKNDMIQQVQNSYQFHGLPGDDANKHLDKFLHVIQSIKVNGVTDDALRLYLFPHSLTHHATNWFDCLLRRPEECYDLIENMTAHHNDWDTSSSDTEIAALKAKMAKINKNLIRVLQTQNVYAAGAYQGNSYQPQGNRNLLSYHSDNYLGPSGLNQNQNQNNQNHNFQNQNRNQGNHNPQGNNQGRNQFFQGTNQGQNQPLAYQALVYQALVHQPQIPQPQIVTTNEFTNFMKANDSILRNMKTNMNSLTNSNLELKNMFGQLMKMNTTSSSSSGTLPSKTITNTKEELKGITTRSGTAYPGPTIPTTSSSPVVERETEETKDTVHPTNNGKLADHSISHSVGVVEDVFIKVGIFHFLADFVVIDFDADPRVPLILERSFLKTGRALIYVFEGELTLRVGKEAITFNLDQTSRYSANYNNMTESCIDVSDMACEEYSQEVLSFSDVIASGNPTPYYDPIISTTSLTLTPFENSDFLLEEVDAFLAIEDDPTLPEVDQSYVDTEGDILLVEAFLNDDPSLPPPNQGNYLPLVCDDKLPVTIPKDLSVGEENRSYNGSEVVQASHCLESLRYQGSWVSPVYCVPKKGGFTVVENEENELILTRLVTGWRVCIDYHKEKTTFTCPYGTFAYRRMPFGLCNAPGTFQRRMMAIFHDMIEKTIEVFMDDFLIFKNSFQTCLFHLEKMLKRCEDTNLCLNWKKSHFMVNEGIVLGHKISKEGIKVDKAKVDVITKLPHPTTVKGIRIFLGHPGFYRCFIKDFSKIDWPMTRLLEKDTAIWRTLLKKTTFLHNTFFSMDSLSTPVVSAAKLPILNPNEFDLWKMRIEQYFLMPDYSMWEVIINGDSPGPIIVVDGFVQLVTHKSADQKLARRNKLKARAQNLAFMSSSNTDSTTDSVSAATSVFAVCAKLPVSSHPNIDSFSNADTRRTSAVEPQRRTAPVEHSTSNALVSQCDCIRSYDWSYQIEEEPANFALMAITSSSSSSDNELSPAKPAQDLSHTTRPLTPIIKDWVSDSEDESEPNDPQSVPIFVQSSEHVKTPRHYVQPIEAPILDATPKPTSPKNNSSCKKKNRKTCFVCRSVDHLIKDCDFHAKTKAQPTPRNYAHRGNNKQNASFTRKQPQKHIVLAAVLTKSKPVSITAVRPVSATVPKIMVTRPRHAHSINTKSKSTIRRHITRTQSSKTSNSPLKVTAAKAPMVSAAKGKKGKWVWRPKCHILDHDSSASMILK